jgi:hypothetical protein
VILDFCFFEDFGECLEDVLERGLEDDLAERFEDDVEGFFEDDLDEGLDSFKCLLAEVESSETVPGRDWAVPL